MKRVAVITGFDVYLATLKQQNIKEKRGIISGLVLNTWAI